MTGPTTTEEWLGYIRWELDDFAAFLRDQDDIRWVGALAKDVQRLTERVCNPDNLPAAWADYCKERDA